MDWDYWERQFLTFLTPRLEHADAGHDVAHLRRVLANAKHLVESIPNARWDIIFPAIWLHDCVLLPKNSPERHTASKLAADTAIAYLDAIGYFPSCLPAIHHAILAHSYSAAIPPETLEAQIVQDADRLDALGAIGIARCFLTGGVLGQPLYHAEEPFPMSRTPDDRQFVLDHFFQKILKLADTMQTPAGRQEAQRRTAFVQSYLDQFRQEIY